MYGFQLWANLPSALKMTAPRYQDVKGADVPEIEEADGTKIRIICGSFNGVKGPVDNIAAAPIYLDVSVPSGQTKTIGVEATRHAFAYVFAGAGAFGDASGPTADNRSLVIFDNGDEVMVRAGDDGVRFLLVSGRPLGEPVAWRGPIVMNTQEELRQAFDELDKGTFLKH